MSQQILLPGDGSKGAEGSDPTIVLQEGIREIQHTTLGDRDAPRRLLQEQLAEGKEDWGDGFHVDPEPVVVDRAPDGSIVRTTPLSEIPGVTFRGGRLEQIEKSTQTLEAEAKVVEAKPTPVPLSRADRTKLTEILARRLCNFWRDRGPGDPRYNPYRDGIPELPAGSPEHLKPLPGTILYPATDGQIMDYARRFVGERAEVINKNRFGGGIEDLALRIN